MRSWGLPKWSIWRWKPYQERCFTANLWWMKFFRLVCTPLPYQGEGLKSGQGEALIFPDEVKSQQNPRLIKEVGDQRLRFSITLQILN